MNQKASLLLTSKEHQKIDMKVFKNYLRVFLKNKSESSKGVFMVGDLDINSFYYESSKLETNYSIWFFKVNSCILYRGQQEQGEQQQLQLTTS